MHDPQLRPRIPHKPRWSAAMAIIAGAGFMQLNAWAQPPPKEIPDGLKKLTIEELMNIEVTSVSRRPERLSVTASAIQVITQEDIRRSGATSLPEALRLAGNLEVAQVDARQWAISARGFNAPTANKLLVLIDGRTVYTPLYAGVFWDVQDTMLEDIDRIEVISGPGATLWGANAVNGVINITTRNAQDTGGALLSAGGGNELQKFGAMRFGSTLGRNIHYRVYGKYFDRDAVELSNGASAMDGRQMLQGGFRADGTLTAIDTLTIQGDWYRGETGQLALNDIEVSGANLLGRWSRTLSEQSDLKLQVYFDRTQRRMPGSITQDLDILDLDFQHRLALDRHEVVWGADFRHMDDAIVNPPNLAFLPPKVTRSWYGMFVQDEIALVRNRLHLTVGSKFEHNEYTGFEVQPSARLAWRLRANDLFWSAISRAVRTPSRIDGELYSPANPPHTVLVGNPDFESEKLTAYELGYRTQALQRASASLTAFYSDYDDVRSIERLNPPAATPFMLGNGLTAKTYGIELVVNYALTDAWRLRAGYTDFRIDFDRKPGSTDTNLGSAEARDTEKFWSLRSSLDLSSALQLDATFRHVGQIPSQNLPAYRELEVRIGWQLPNNLQLSIIGQNLLHARHAEYGAIGTTPANSRKYIERSILGKLTWRY